MYAKPPAFARKDALTPSKYNHLRGNLLWLEGDLRAEHRESGEHNIDRACRTLGTVRHSAGYALSGFNSDASLQTGYNPAVGDVIVTLDHAALGRFPSQGSVMVQNASASGSSVPCITMANMAPGSPSVVELYSAKMTGSLGAGGGNTWAMENASVWVGVSNDQLDIGVAQVVGAPRSFGQGLRASGLTSDWNRFISSAATVEAAFASTHLDATLAGVLSVPPGGHNVKEIARAWAHVQWNGSTYDVVAMQCDDDSAGIATVTRSGAGQLVVDTGGASDIDTAVFVEPDYARLTGGTAADYFIACVPDGAGGGWPSQFELFLYQKLRHLNHGFSPAHEDEYWDRADCDFFVWVFRSGH